MKSVSIVPLGRIQEEILAAIEGGLARAYGVDVRRIEGLPEPEYAFDAQRGQYSSAHILRQMVPRVPAGALSMLAITQQDLFIPMLSFVLGQAQLGAPAAVVSLARLDQEFYGLPPDRALFIERSVKEAVHEVGHTIGLTHCTNTLCPMSLSNNVLHVDIKGAQLCGNCAVLLKERMSSIPARENDTDGTEMRKT